MTSAATAVLCQGAAKLREETGNEYIFQMLAKQNVETLNGIGVRKIITQCPHCFNTLGNEYPQLGGHYEVVHHSQFLEWLVEQGRLDLSEARLDADVPSQVSEPGVTRFDGLTRIGHGRISSR